MSVSEKVSANMAVVFEEFSQMLDRSLQAINYFTVGERITTEVVSVSGSNVFIDIDGKSELLLVTLDKCNVITQRCNGLQIIIIKVFEGLLVELFSKSSTKKSKNFLFIDCLINCLSKLPQVYRKSHMKKLFYLVRCRRGAFKDYEV